jgi:hypothetical protein
MQQTSHSVSRQTPLLFRVRQNVRTHVSCCTQQSGQRVQIRLNAMTSWVGQGKACHNADTAICNFHRATAHFIFFFFLLFTLYFHLRSVEHKQHANFSSIIWCRNWVIANFWPYTEGSKRMYMCFSIQNICLHNILKHLRFSFENVCR